MLVVLCVLSVGLFGSPMPTFLQFILGGFTTFNFFKNLKINDMKNNVIRWVEVNAGRFHKALIS